VLPHSKFFNAERAKIYTSSSCENNHSDYKVPAFVAAFFPPVNVGKHAAECLTLHNHQYPSQRSKKVTIESILDGSATLSFEGFSQVREHASSKCHKEAFSFWKKENVLSTTFKHPTPQQVKTLSKKAFLNSLFSLNLRFL